ncbi:molecular chaperone DnaK, partial [Candidatus Bathyarchaeota archaeon]
LEDAKLTPNDVDKIILMGGMTRMPLVQQSVKQALRKAPERGLDPMECVAIGAAIQAAVITGEVTDLLLLDVTPLSLGVETQGGVRTKVIDKNTTIPTKKSQIFSTAADFQTAVTIHVLQGERAMASDNVSLGMFNLVDIPPAPKGVPQIEVTFDIDANGILNVTAKDLGTGKQSKITITASTKLSKEDKEKMIKEAEEFSEQDKTKREEAELRNNADSMIYTADRTKKDLADKLKPDQTEKIDKAVNELKDAIAKKDMSLLKQKSEELQKVLQDIGTVIYQQAAAEKAKQEQAQASQPNPNSSSTSNNAEKVVDSEDYKVQ